ncbi:MAG: nucleotidyltransferase family protein [Sediminibacterium sp.]
MNLLLQHINTVNDLCRKHKVKELYAYGSVLDENRFNKESDIDMIVKFDQSLPVEKYFDVYFDLLEELEQTFERKIDLMIAKEIRNQYLRKSIETTKQLIYAA